MTYRVEAWGHATNPAVIWAVAGVPTWIYKEYPFVAITLIEGITPELLASMIVCEGSERIQ